MTEEETIFDDELNDDFLPTAANEGGEGELYEHFRVIVDKGQDDLFVLISFSLNECNTPVVIVSRRLLTLAISM